MTTLLQSCLFLLVLSNFLLLGTRRVAGMTRLTAFQGVLLAALLLSLDHALLAGAVLLIKGALLPGLLWRTQKRLPADGARLNQCADRNNYPFSGPADSKHPGSRKNRRDRYSFDRRYGTRRKNYPRHGL